MLVGCQTGHPLSLQQTGEPFTVMAFWAQYQACLGTSDLETARSLADQLRQIPVRGVEPPAWIKFFGVDVAAQPLRVAVNPQALGADCALRAARLAREANLFHDAHARYHDIIKQYADSEYVYYVDQARQALIDLKDAKPVLLVRTPALPH